VQNAVSFYYFFQLKSHAAIVRSARSRGKAGISGDVQINQRARTDYGGGNAPLRISTAALSKLEKKKPDQSQRGTSIRLWHATLHPAVDEERGPKAISALW